MSRFNPGVSVGRNERIGQRDEQFACSERPGLRLDFHLHGSTSGQMLEALNR